MANVDGYILRPVPCSPMMLTKPKAMSSQGCHHACKPSLVKEARSDPYAFDRAHREAGTRYCCVWKHGMCILYTASKTAIREIAATEIQGHGSRCSGIATSPFPP
jgi:hypothetical protein